MNKQRRKAVMQLSEKLKKIQADMQNELQAAIADLETIKDEEQDYLDNMPENMQGGERYSNTENCISELEDIQSELENMDSSIDELAERLENAVNEQ